MRDALIERFREGGHQASRDGDADIVIDGRLRGRRLQLQARRGSDTERVRVSARGADALAERAEARLARWISQQGAPQPEPEREEEQQQVEEEEEVTRAPERARPTQSARPPEDPYDDGGSPEPSFDADWKTAPSALELTSAFALFGRRLTYTDDLFSRLSDYEILPAPRFAASLTWFPIRHFSNELFAGIGVGATMETAFALQSSDGQDQTTIPTRAYAWGFDFRYELPVDLHRFTLSLGYGEEVYASDLPAPPPGPRERATVLPLHYRFFRPAIAGEFRLHELFSAGASFGWRSVLSTTGFDQSFGLPPSEGGGFDAGFVFAVHLAWYLEVRLRGEYHRYFFSFHPELGDHYVVGGALDEWTSLSLEVAVTLPGAAQ